MARTCTHGSRATVRSCFPTWFSLRGTWRVKKRRPRSAAPVFLAWRSLSACSNSFQSLRRQWGSLVSNSLGIRFLVVDDEESIRQLCVTVAESLGFACSQANNGEAALAILD